MYGEQKSRYGSAGLVLLGLCVAVVASGFLCGCDSRESDDAYFCMGAAFAGLGQWGEAIGAYRSVLHIEPNNTRAQFNIGVVQLKAGRYNKAIGAFWDIVSVPRVSYRTLRLEADDYVPPECLPDNEGDTEEYVRGYVEGWRRYASRWRGKVFRDGYCTEHGAGVACRRDGSPFEV